MITDINRGELIATARAVLLVHRRLKQALDDSSHRVDGLNVAGVALIDELRRQIGNMTQLHTQSQQGDPIVMAATIIIAAGGEVSPSDL